MIVRFRNLRDFYNSFLNFPVTVTRLFATIIYCVFIIPPHSNCNIYYDTKLDMKYFLNKVCYSTLFR